MRRITCYLAIVLSSQIAIAEDWPQWQGPNRNAVSGETGLLPRGGQPRGNNAPPSASVAGTENPTLYVSEHWGMTGFNQKLPNGKYQVNLHFAETYQGITAAGQRVFSFKVQGKEFKDFDVFQKAGGLRKAYVESVPVEVNDGELKITFKGFGNMFR